MPRGIPNRKPEAPKPVPVVVAAPPPPPPVPPAPEPPNPVILALQEHILGLVNQRSALQVELSNANAQLRNAQAAAESARERLQMVEGEVQYRLGLIAQLQGKPAMQGWATEAAFPGTPQPSYAEVQRKLAMEQGAMTFSAQPISSGMGSIPAQRPTMAGVVGEVRSESAEDERRAM